MTIGKLTLLYSLFTFVLLSGSFSLKAQDVYITKQGNIIIEWTDSLAGDFSFREKWEYPAGVFRNSFGQISCDGLCPEGVWGMKNREGMIYKDSLKQFYQLVDTTHLLFTLESTSNCYEFGGTNYIEARKNENGIVKCATANNVGTHSSLQFELLQDTCLPVIELNSITELGIHQFECTDGKILVDRELWRQGILKAKFHFGFHDDLDTNRSMYWKGEIYTEIGSQ